MQQPYSYDPSEPKRPRGWWRTLSSTGPKPAKFSETTGSQKVVAITALLGVLLAGVVMALLTR